MNYDQIYEQQHVYAMICVDLVSRGLWDDAAEYAKKAGELDALLRVALQRESAGYPLHVARPHKEA